jgi:hypothetical protein
MKLGRNVLSLAFAALAASSAQAGWVSGGGELVKNKNNPWFVQNTPTVNYCIERDPTTFRMSDDRLNELVGKALDYWRAEFSRAHLSSGGSGPEMRLLTQTYVRQSCTQDVDLRFQFGVLAGDQRRSLGIDPKEHVAFTIRTDYDERKLKAKGFLYVTPDNGPERYRGDEYRDGVWHEADNRYLFEILVHELGHTLGMPHFGNSLMAEEFGELLVHYSRIYPREGDVEVATLGFNFDFPGTRCWEAGDDGMDRGFVIAFFELPKTFECLRFAFERDPRDELIVRSANLTYSVGDEWHDAGRIEFTGWSMDSTPNIKLKYRAEQEVFPVDGSGTVFTIPSDLDQLTGWFTPSIGQVRKYVSIELEPEMFRVLGFYPERGLRHLMFYARSSEREKDK